MTSTCLVSKRAPATRPAVAEDAETLARLFDMADGGLSRPRWAAAAAPGQSPFAVGAEEIISNRTRQSLRDAEVATLGRTVVGALLSYRMAPKMIGKEDTPYDRLKAEVPGSWYIDSLAVEEVWRRGGVGELLLAAAANKARFAGCISLSLLVYDTNVAAAALYARYGFLETNGLPLPTDHPSAAHFVRLLQCKIGGPQNGSKEVSYWS
jgi:ribosomal protein S18 acetylase RimI-like enzyme